MTAGIRARDVVASIDPRIEERRAAVERARMRRRRRVLLVLAGIVLAAGGAVLAVRSPLLDVDEVRVVGAARTGEDTVRAAAGITPGEPLLTADLDAARRAVEALPWVDEATVRRDWPGRVVVTLEERTPVAFAVQGGETALVDAENRVLARLPTAEAASATTGLVELVGLRVLPVPGETLYPRAVAGLRERLPAALADRLVAIDLSRSDDVVLRLLFAPEIRLGDLDDVEAKAAAAAAVLDRLGDAAGEVRYVDVRVPSTPVAGRHDGTAIPGLDAPVDR